MEQQELFKKIRKIEIKTRGLTRNIFAGEYQSAFKGMGMAFSEVREYQVGDDIRSIDWNVTARFNSPFVKVFNEERELTVLLLIDVSASQNFGSKSQSKVDLLTELSALLAFSAITNNDKIGVILFSDKIEKFITPKKGSSHILRIIRELIEFKPENTGTDINQAFEFTINAIKKRAIVFVMSDFLQEANYEKSLSIISKKHDTIFIRTNDEREDILPQIGVVDFYDPEAKSTYTINTNSKDFQLKYESWRKLQKSSLQSLANKFSVDLIQINTGGDYILPIQQFFKMREWRRKLQ